MAGDGAWTYVLDEPVRLLVVDDDPILREFAMVHLGTPTAEIETAENGEVAWAMLQARHYDLVLTDLEMPVLDGFGLLQRIRSDPRLTDLPCVMLTGREDIASIDRAFELGSSFFATKPVNWRLLSYQLRHVLRSGRTETSGGEETDASRTRLRIALETIAAAASPGEAETRETTEERFHTIAREANAALGLVEDGEA